MIFEQLGDITVEEGVLKEGFPEEVTFELSPKRYIGGIHAKSECSGRRKHRGRVPKTDMKMICSGVNRSVCAGGERSSRGGGRGGQGAGEEDVLYAACHEGLSRGSTLCMTSLRQSSSWLLSGARLEGLEGSKTVTEARPVGGERGARDEIFLKLNRPGSCR